MNIDINTIWVRPWCIKWFYPTLFAESMLCYSCVKCICGKKIKKKIKITNTVTKISLTVSSSHINGILNDKTNLKYQQYNNAYIELRKIAKNVKNGKMFNMNLSIDLLNYLYNTKVIDKSELKLLTIYDKSMLLDVLLKINLIDKKVKKIYSKYLNKKMYGCKTCHRMVINCLQCSEKLHNICQKCGYYKKKNEKCIICKKIINPHHFLKNSETFIIS